MAVESPIVNMSSAFSPYTEFSLSPNSPAMPNPGRFQSLSARSSTEGSSLSPTSVSKRVSLELASPSDMVEPSPVTSNGTEATDIDDEAVIEESETEEHGEDEQQPVQVPHQMRMLGISTNMPDHYRTPHDDEPNSVIHAPQNYMSFNNTTNHNPPQLPLSIERSTPKPFQARNSNNLTVDSLTGGLGGDKTITPSPVSPPPITTDHPPDSFSPDQATPRAQTRQEVETLTERTRLRSSSANSLEGIPEDTHEDDPSSYDTHDAEDAFPAPPDPDAEVTALKTALHECWTLCNTLANLSSTHRARIYQFSGPGTGDAHEKAWKCCWRLCIKLYSDLSLPLNSYQPGTFSCRPTLDLCREFCQSLFDVRNRDDGMADSVLRVCFELNNHLFNTHDRNLPEAFRERTLDFYVTLCHRLMKQRGGSAEEGVRLLRACWSLAEMLFSLRQGRIEGNEADEELLGSAVLACWELCDLFRDGWTQVRPERGTPRPSQTTFTQSFDQYNRGSQPVSTLTGPGAAGGSGSLTGSGLTRTKSNSSMSSMSSLPSRLHRVESRPLEPETPCTEFEDTPISPEAGSPQMPNIMILGPERGPSAQSGRWSSNSSQLSGYSEGSNKTSSTVKTGAGGKEEDVNLTRLKILILKAAQSSGFERAKPVAGSTVPKSPVKLQEFVKSLPTGSFGSLPWHASLLASYKDLVSSDPTFKSERNLPAVGKRAGAVEVSKSVGWMMQRGQYLWLKDLYRLVFGFGVEEAETKRGAAIVI